MKNLFKIFLVLILLFSAGQAFAVELITTTQSNPNPKIEEDKVTFYVKANVLPGNNETKITTIINTTTNNTVLGPITSLYKYDVLNGIAIPINTSSLQNGVTYNVMMIDDAGGAEVQTNFTNINRLAPTGEGNWYYTTSFDINAYKTNIHDSFFRFTTKTACETAYYKSVDDMYIDGAYERDYTKCFEDASKIPTEAEFRSKLEEYGTFESSVALFYQTYSLDSVAKPGNWSRSDGYKDKATCERYMDKAYLYIIKCEPSKTPPKEPANWGYGYNISGSQKDFDDTYRLLAPIGGLEKIDKDTKIGDYLNIMFKIGIGLAGVLAVIMIVINGVLYMGDESVFGKTQAKERIITAIGGLLLALGSYAILNTINPDLVNTTLRITPVSIEIEGDVNAPVNVNKVDYNSLGIQCTQTGGVNSLVAVAKSFNGKMTYSQDLPKGQLSTANKVKLDCSGYVNAVLSCAGIPNTTINSGTSIIFKNLTKVDKSKTTDTSIDGIPLEIGDLVGWTEQEEKNGHVVMYIGGGKFVDSHGLGSYKPDGNSYGEFSLTAKKYISRVTYVKRIKDIN